MCDSPREQRVVVGFKVVKEIVGWTLLTVLRSPALVREEAATNAYLAVKGFIVCKDLGPEDRHTIGLGMSYVELRLPWVIVRTLRRGDVAENGVASRMFRIG